MTTPGLGGLQPPPMNAPAGGVLTPGVTPGVTPNVFIGRYVVVFGPSGGVFVYNGTPALGNGPIFWATAASTDPYGNAVTPTSGIQGTGTFTAGTSSGTQIQLAVSGGAGMLNFLLNNSGITNGFLEGINFGSVAEILMQGPQNKTAGFTDLVTLTMESSDGVSLSAGLQLGYVDANGVTHGYLVESFAGVVIDAGSIAAVEPGTGTSATNPATGEVWHTMPAFGTGFSHGTTAPGYKLYPDDTVALAGEINVTAGTTSGAIVTLPTSAYFPLTGKVFSIEVNAGTPATSGTARLTLSTAGALALASGPTVAAYSISMDSIRYPLDY